MKNRSKKYDVSTNVFALAAMAVFGGMFETIKGGFSPTKLVDEKRCLECGKKTKTGHSFCSVKHMADWKAFNPYNGRATHKHDPDTGGLVVTPMVRGKYYNGTGRLVEYGNPRSLMTGGAI